jgi:hypothetical protein
VFVDNAETQAMLEQTYRLRHTKVLDKLLRGGLHPDKKAKLQREYRGLQSAIDNIHVVNPNAQGRDNQENRPGDVLYVKGHGSAKNPDAISTLATPVDEAFLEPPGLFERTTTVRVQRGFKMKHSAQEIGTAVHHIANAVDSPGLYVRLTSCGSAGTPSRKAVDINPPDLSQTFAGKVAAQLNTLHTDPRVHVSGFQGDSNSTFPLSSGTGDGFVTKIKQGKDQPERFLNAIERQTTKQGPLRERNEPRKRPLRELKLGEKLKNDHPAPAMAALGVPPVMQQRMQSVTRITVTDRVDTQRVAVGPRANALVYVRR